MSSGILAWFLDALMGISKEPAITVTERFAWNGSSDRMNTPMDSMILNRVTFSPRSTIGELYLDGSMQCYMLEPTCQDQGPNVKLAIPQGRYELVMYDSARLLAKVRRWKAAGLVLDPIIEAAKVPLLLKVPGHDFVEMHPGNGPEDTHDCLLPGLGCSIDWVSHSEKAFIGLVQKLEEKLKAGKFYIGITGGGK